MRAKWFSALLPAALSALSGLSACGGGGSDDDAGAPNASVTLQAVGSETAAGPPLRYGPTVVGVLGDRMFALTIAQPFVVRRDASPPTGDLHAAPAPWLVGTVPTPSGRVPTGYSWQGASGPGALSYRFNPVTARTSSTLAVDPAAADHGFSRSAGSFAVGPGWGEGAGGLGTAPTATAKYWTSDGSGGWFYVEAADLETLLHRDASGAVETVFRDAGLSFGTMHTLAN